MGKIITYIICILVWVCTLFAADIEVDFSDGSKLQCRGWARKVVERRAERRKNHAN